MDEEKDPSANLVHLRESISSDLFKRARVHRAIAGCTVFSSIALLLVGLISLAVGVEPADSATAAVTDGVFRLLYMSVIVFAAQILASMYRYNMKVHGHWVARAYALKLASHEEGVEGFKELVIILDSAVVFDKLPSKPFFQFRS